MLSLKLNTESLITTTQIQVLTSENDKDIKKSIPDQLELFPINGNCSNHFNQSSPCFITFEPELMHRC